MVPCLIAAEVPATPYVRQSASTVVIEVTTRVVVTGVEMFYTIAGLDEVFTPFFFLLVVGALFVLS